MNSNVSEELEKAERSRTRETVNIFPGRRKTAATRPEKIKLGPLTAGWPRKALFWQKNQKNLALRPPGIRTQEAANPSRLAGNECKGGGVLQGNVAANSAPLSSTQCTLVL